MPSRKIPPLSLHSAGCKNVPMSGKLAIPEGYGRMLTKKQEAVAPYKHVNKFLMRNIGVG